MIFGIGKGAPAQQPTVAAPNDLERMIGSFAL